MSLFHTMILYRIDTLLINSVEDALRVVGRL